MDRTDMRIMAALEKDGRQSLTALAESIGLSKTPCWSRVQGLEKRGVIGGYHAAIEPAALGLHVTAFVAVMIDFSKRADFEAAVVAHPAILECATTAGESDYILKVVTRDVIELDGLLRHSLSLLPGLQRSTTTICLKTIKSRGSLAAASEFRASER